MALHPNFPLSPYEVLPPDLRWFPAAEELRSTAYEKLLPPLVAKVREEVKAWRDANYAGASATSRALLTWWFDVAHTMEQADGTQTEFRYYFAQREAVETVIWLYDVRGARDKFDLLRFDASGAVSSNMFDEDWPRFVVKMATGAGKTKVLSLLMAWSYFHKLYEANSALARNFLLIAPNIIVLDRLRADFDGLRIFFNDPVLPDNGHAGQNWRDDFQVALHIQDDVRIVRPTGDIFLTNIHRVYLGDVPEPSLDDDDLRDYFLAPFGSKPAGKTNDSNVDLGEVVREIDELAVFNDEAHHIHDNRLAWFQCIQDIHHRMLQKDLRLTIQVDVTATPRHENGAIFVQTVSDYPLVEAIAQNVVSVFVYSRSEQPLFVAQYVEKDEKLLDTHYRHVDEATGRRYNLDNFTQAGAGPARLFGGQLLDPPPGKHWIWSQERIDDGMKEGLIVFSKNGVPYVKRYFDGNEGTRVGDIWDDIFPVNQMAKERLDYPTQKPEALLERIIKASSNEGDLVADFFAGSGTTAAVAEKLGRKWIATDLGKFGIHTTRKRLIGVQREKKAAEQDFRAFEVLNLGRYERQAYLNVGGRLSTAQKAQALAQKEAEFRELILRAYKATGFGSNDGGQAQDGFFHGARNGRLVVIGPINLPVGRLFVEEVITECRKRGASRVDVLAFEFEMGLFPAVLEEARGKGIELAPKYIPAEVFDKRAVDKGQVVFHDISFVEATPRYDKKAKLAVKIELTDFSVYYTQGAADAAIAAMKEGKSEVMCEQGQLYKVSKSKDGIVKKDRLTKHWTDWVDYWAVDFDYLQRKEIIKVPVNAGLGGVASVPAAEFPGAAATLQFEERWTGGYIFENEWQSFRTRQNRELELTTALHTYDRPGRYTVAVKVIDIFGNDTMTLVPVNVG